MADPRIPQGNLNKLKASLVWNDFPNLNVIPSYLGAEGISISFEGAAVARLPSMTGIVNSPEPFQPIIVTLHLLRTQQLAQLYEQQRQAQAVIGNGTVRLDVSLSTPNPGPYECLNMSISNVGELRLNGSDAGFMVTTGGYMLVNSFLWD
jgi:hypothetical protein